jgi:hypothetical protein
MVFVASNGRPITAPEIAEYLAIALQPCPTADNMQSTAYSQF